MWSDEATFFFHNDRARCSSGNLSILLILECEPHVYLAVLKYTICHKSIAVMIGRACCIKTIQVYYAQPDLLGLLGFDLYTIYCQNTRQCAILINSNPPMVLWQLMHLDT